MLITLTENQPTFNNGRTNHLVPLSGEYHIYYLGSHNSLSVIECQLVPIVSDVLGLSCITSWDESQNYGTQNPRLGITSQGNVTPSKACPFYIGKRHINGYIDIQNQINSTGSTEFWAIHLFDVYRAF